jgi:hypothetical protein
MCWDERLSEERNQSEKHELFLLEAFMSLKKLGREEHISANSTSGSYVVTLQQYLNSKLNTILYISSIIAHHT